MVDTIGYICAFTVVLFFIIFAIAIEVSRKKQRKAEWEKYVKKYDEWVQWMNNAISQYNNYVASWGTPDNIILIDPSYQWAYYGEIRIYSRVEKLIVQGLELDFSSITSCKIDTYRKWIQRGGATIVTTGSIRTHSSGGILAGNSIAGSISSTRGGINATSNVYYRPDTINEEWVVIISTRFYSMPMIPIYLGYNKMKADTIVSLINAILYNQQKN